MFDVVIIGAGQAGLTMSDHLRREGIEHVVLERHRIAERWRSERWRSLRFQFPNWSLRLPGQAYGGSQPDGFAHHSEILQFIEDYANRIDAPVRENSHALRLSRAGQNYVIETPSGPLMARQVVIATGPFQRPWRPAFAGQLPSSIFQIDARQYVSPHELPNGASLVVGSGASGYQIAEDLQSAGHQVYLAISSHKRVPRRYRDKDCYWWFERMGRFDAQRETADLQKLPPSVIVTGVDGGRDVNVRQLRRDGVSVLGPIEDVADNKLQLRPCANQLLDAADQAFADFVAAADRHARTAGLDNTAACEDISDLLGATDPLDEITALDLRAAGITSVIWATGYRYAFDWVDLPIFDRYGSPQQQRGVTALPGVYFLGLHWMHTFGSGLLPFVARDAAFIAEHMTGKAAA